MAIQMDEPPVESNVEHPHGTITMSTVDPEMSFSDYVCVEGKCPQNEYQGPLNKTNQNKEGVHELGNG